MRCDNEGRSMRQTSTATLPWFRMVAIWPPVSNSLRSAATQHRSARLMTGSRRRLCVLTIIDCMMTSGAEIIATQIATNLDPSRFESIICSTRSSAPEHVASARAAGIEVLELRRRSKLDVWRWSPLLRLMRSGRIDVVHAHKFGSNLWASVLSQFADIPVLLAHEHTWSFAGKPLRRLIDREIIARSATAVLAVSEADRKK